MVKASMTACTRPKVTYDSSSWLPMIVGIAAAAIGFYAQYDGFLNPYIVNGDVPQHIYWMQQFRDSEIFRNDLLTEFAKSMQPWGAVFVYRVFSPYIDPLILCKILPIILCAVSSLYLFKLLQHLAGTLAGLIGASLFVAMPVFLGVLAGGTPRAYVYPLIISFLFFLLRRDYFKAAIVLILQPLFYPSAFFVCGMTFFLSFLSDRPARFSRVNKRKLWCFIISILVGVSILTTKYFIAKNPELGSIVTKQQVEQWPELGIHGRYAVIPTGSISSALVQQTRATLISFVASSPIYSALTALKPDSIPPGKIKASIAWFSPFALATLVGFVIFQAKNSALKLPAELIYLFAASVIMFQAADWVFLRLWLPARYIQYSIPLLMVIFISIAMVALIEKVKVAVLRNVLAFVLVAVLGMHFHFNKNAGMDDQTPSRALYDYMATVPKDSLIAAHPMTGDYIPTFSKRKVFLSYELSQPYVDKYWFTLRRRTYEFFDAYYASDPAEIIKFCRKNNIDYLVVDRRHFSSRFLNGRKMYFEPFNSYIRELTGKRTNYAILQFPGKRIELPGGAVFVIDVRTLRV